MYGPAHSGAERQGADDHVGGIDRAALRRHSSHTAHPMRVPEAAIGMFRIGSTRGSMTGSRRRAMVTNRGNSLNPTRSAFRRAPLSLDKFSYDTSVAIPRCL